MFFLHIMTKIVPVDLQIDYNIFLNYWKNHWLYYILLKDKVNDLFIYLFYFSIIQLGQLSIVFDPTNTHMYAHM